MKIRILRVLGYCASIIWIISGLIIIGSIFLSAIGVYINLTVGLLFIIAGIYLIWRNMLFINFLMEGGGIQTKTYNKIVIAEIILFKTLFLFGLVIFSAIFFRVFIEKYAVFG
ncbi:MAG: hypothetical protein V2I46_06340 [Bacteroides sp.]|nr:hypothetical protein [Bacteroides sp.]